VKLLSTSRAPIFKLLWLSKNPIEHEPWHIYFFSFPICAAILDIGFGYCFILDPLFWECPYPKALLYKRNLEWGNSEKNKLNLKLYSNSSL
jgi:hypothetical protein